MLFNEFMFFFLIVGDSLFLGVDLVFFCCVLFFGGRFFLKNFRL